uniref:Uncharacterized protein n=1 Tax=Amphiprion percula TaxID=161767 RepID=A0A3P8TCB3_AMPPE
YRTSTVDYSSYYSRTTAVLQQDYNDSMSGTSVSDVNDRLSALELRVQQQEDELTVMKAALADVLRRLAASEDSAATATKKQHGRKGTFRGSMRTI